MEQTTKKRPRIGLIILIILIVIVMAAGGVVGWCFLNSSQGDQALAANDFDAARASYEKDFISGAAKLTQVDVAQAQYYVDQKQYPEAIAMYQQLGMEEELLQTQLLYGQKLMSMRNFQEAMELYAQLGEAHQALWNEAAAQHARDLVNQELYAEAETLVSQISDPELVAYTINKLNIHKFQEAVKNEDMEAAFQLIQGITDRNFLTTYDYNDFNYLYAIELLKQKDVEGAMEFFGYCAFQDDRNYTLVLKNLLGGNIESAAATKRAMTYSTLAKDIGMTWQELVYFLTDTKLDSNDLNSLLYDNYLNLTFTQYDTFKQESYMFDHGEYSSSSTPSYVGPVAASEYQFPVESLDDILAQCGSNPQGKVLFMRSQVDYPRSGKTHYSVHLGNMSRMDRDLAPADLSQVEYIVMLCYDYNGAGTYRRTLFGEVDIFQFLRFKGQVKVIQVSDKKTIYSSPWVVGTGEPDLWGPEVWQGSNLPNMGDHVITAFSKIP